MKAHRKMSSSKRVMEVACERRAILDVQKKVLALTADERSSRKAAELAVPSQSFLLQLLEMTTGEVLRVRLRRIDETNRKLKRDEYYENIDQCDQTARTHLAKPHKPTNNKRSLLAHADPGEIDVGASSPDDKTLTMRTSQLSSLATLLGADRPGGPERNVRNLGCR